MTLSRLKLEAVVTTLVPARDLARGPVARSNAGLAIGRTPYALTAMLGVAAAIACLGSLFLPDVLRGPAVAIGQLRGTAAIVAFVGLPVLAISTSMVARGSERALFGWIGALGFIGYQGVLFLFASPFNSLFIPYVAVLALSVWSLIALIPQVRVDDLAAGFSSRTPVRAVAAYLAIMGALFLVLWLSAVVPPSVSNTVPPFLEGTGMLTGPVQVIDLGFTLPLMFAGSIQLWRRRPWGYLVSGTMLVMLAIETVSIATDQWFGHAADPASPAASADLVPVFAVFTIVGLGALVAFLARPAGPTA